MALADRRGYLHMFKVVVEGERKGGSKWMLSVHPPNDQETTTEAFEPAPWAEVQAALKKAAP